MTSGAKNVSPAMQIPYLDLKRSSNAHAASSIAAFERVLDSGWFVLGREVEAFEREWAAHCGAAHCTGTGNALDGLEIALRALDLPEGGEVVVPSNTYIATWLAVTNVGLKVRPVEPDAITHNLTADGVRAAIDAETTVAVLAVHLFGQLADEEICDVAVKAGIPVVFDAAQAHGAKTETGLTSGNLGDVAVHSFYPTKNLGALGDGGAITTDLDAVNERARLLRNYGSKRKYENEVRGRNSRLDEVQAAILRERLDFLDAENDRRREIAGYYSTSLSGIENISVPAAPSDGGRHVWHAYNIICQSDDHRERLQGYLASRGIGTQVFYPIPPHMSDAYSDLGWRPDDFPVARDFARTSLALPIAPYLTDAEVEQVANAIKLCSG